MAARPRLYLADYAAGDEARFTPCARSRRDMALNGWRWADGPPEGRVWRLCRPGGEVVGLTGLSPTALAFQWHAWAILAELTPRDVAFALRLARRELDLLEGRVKPRLITAHAAADFPAAARTLARLGFEGMARDSGYNLMGRVI